MDLITNSANGADHSFIPQAMVPRNVDDRFDDRTSDALTAAHRHHLKHESGINDAVIERANLFSASPHVAKELLNIEQSGLTFPYYDFAGEIVGHRLRLDRPITSDDERPRKYHQKLGTSLSCYFLRDTIPTIKNAAEPLYITEGEKKLLSMASLPSLAGAAITSFPGCWNFREKGARAFAQIWQEIPLKERLIYFLPDSDFFFNESVFNAGSALMRLLFDAKATVRLIDLTGEGDRNAKNWGG